MVKRAIKSLSSKEEEMKRRFEDNKSRGITNCVVVVKMSLYHLHGSHLFMPQRSYKLSERKTQSE